MLNRRQLRIKTLQALYAFYKSQNDNIAKGEKELFHSIDKIYDMYIQYLLIFEDLKFIANETMEERKKKMLPTEEDINPNQKFVNNAIINLLEKNRNLLQEADNRKISWMGEKDSLKKLFVTISKSETYLDYMKTRTSSFEEDKVFIETIFKEEIANFELIHHFFEEKSIYWVDDIDFVCSAILKTIAGFEETSGEFTKILPLYKNLAEDHAFVKSLFRKTILYADEIEEWIQDKAKNWEMDRIAIMDNILMKMGVAEAIELKEIPTKVTLNEYIEISKFYSTPKSNVFINGILDKIFTEQMETGRIRKVGRGLIG